MSGLRSRVLARLVLLVTLAALATSHLEWSHQGHQHVGPDRVVRHHHHHAGAHQHPHPHPASSAEANHHAPTDAPSPTNPAPDSSDTYVASLLLVGSELAERPTLNPPARVVRKVEGTSFLSPLLEEPHHPAVPRGPPAA